MKALVMFVAAFVAVVAAPVIADDGHVSQSTLRALGLGRMQVVSDAHGMQVRGKQFTVSVKGTSLIFGQLLTPDTKNFVVGTSVNEVDAEGVANGDPTATKEHSVALHLNLVVTFPNGDTFTGNIGTFLEPAFAAGVGTVTVTP